jgi:hypothetical protein
MTDVILGRIGRAKMAIYALPEAHRRAELTSGPVNGFTEALNHLDHAWAYHAQGYYQDAERRIERAEAYIARSTGGGR